MVLVFSGLWISQIRTLRKRYVIDAFSGRSACGWNGESKCSARAVVQCRPQTSLMSFNNRTVNSKSDPHAIALCRVEALEELFPELRGKTDARVLHTQLDTFVSYSFRFDQKFPRTIVNRGHRIRRIPQED